MSDVKETVLLSRLEQVAVEVELLSVLLPIALDLEWVASPGAGRDSRVADPTGDTASDTARLHLREQLGRSQEFVDAAFVSLRGVRRGIERTLERYGVEIPRGEILDSGNFLESTVFGPQPPDGLV